MAKLSMDNSASGKARLAELQKELEDSNKDITDMQDDHTRDLRIDNLNNQKDAIETKYDNLLNDERKFAQMRSDIINGNTKDIQKMLDAYYKDIKSKTNALGTSVVNGIIDQINAVKQYLSGIQNPTKSPTTSKPASTPSKPATTGTNKPTSQPKPTTPAKPAAQPKPKNPKTTSALSLRSQPKFGNNVMLTIPKGTEVEYLGMDSGWAKVKYKGKTGFAGKNYLQFKSGGYTGDDEGLAMLHKKEIVLNEMDTSNLLKVIDITRDLISNFKFPDLSNLFQQTAVSTGGNTFAINFNVAKMTGSKSDAEYFMSEIVKGVNARGGKM
jgi:hypothetical protein